jgi:hypothetical protein
MTAAHFIFIPAILVIGIVIGWILGSRAAQDAYAAELRRREERAARSQIPGSKSQAPTTPNDQIPKATPNDQLPTAIANGQLPTATANGQLPTPTPNNNSQET